MVTDFTEECPSDWDCAILFFPHKKTGVMGLGKKKQRGEDHKYVE